MLFFLMGCVKFLMLPYEPDWAGVSAGPYDVCAWRSDNYLACESLKFPGSPIRLDDDVRKSADYMGIAVADDAACTLQISTGKAPYCWGKEGNPILMKEEVVGQDSGADSGADSSADSAGSGDSLGDSEADIALPPLSPISLMAGDLFVCALEEGSKRARCWGEDSQGQVSGVVEGEYDGLFLGGQHACGLQEKKLSCWGESEAAGAAAALPKGVQHAAAGGNITCVQAPAPKGEDTGITPPPRVTCTRDPTDPLAEQIPSIVDTLPGPYKALAVGELGLCGITDNGRLDCVWNSTLGPPTLPDERFASLSLSSRRAFGCGITEAGRLKCFGEDAPDLERWDR